MIDKVKTFLQENNILNKKILIAVSGGRDSIALLNVLYALKDEFQLSLDCGYINHRLRYDSDDEQNFVTATVGAFSEVRLFTRVVDKSRWAKCSNIEATARSIRYEFLQNIATEISADFIATAHHFNDKIETFFINLLRANDIQTLVSIPSRTNSIIRPLINVTRAEIDAFIKQNALDYIDDYTNNTNDYIRNKIRHKIIPSLAEITPHFEQSFAHIFDFFEENAAFIDKQTATALSKCLVRSADNFVIIDRNILAECDNVIKKNIIKKLIYRLNCSCVNIAMFDEILSTKNVRYRKQNLFVISKSNFLYLINVDELSQTQCQTINNFCEKFTLTGQVFALTENVAVEFKAKFAYFDGMFPISVRTFSSTDKMYKNNKLTSVKNILNNDKVPHDLHKYASILTSGDKIIGVFAFGMFRISQDFFTRPDCKTIYII